ncbi:unnamed protein product [Closterium sp. Naga37s-1]|nr:unnamed protein product [Closterium sp. Naga37s-1]
MQRVLSHGLPLTPPPSTPPALGHCHPAGEISPCLPASCRFILTCSEYSVMILLHPLVLHSTPALIPAGEIPPGSQLPAGEISPWIPASCRFVPTCSEYSVMALRKYGLLRGEILTAWRLLRCNPFGPSGYDPPRWFGEPPPPSI